MPFCYPVETIHDHESESYMPTIICKLRSGYWVDQQSDSFVFTDFQSDHRIWIWIWIIVALQEPEAMSATGGCALRKSGEPTLEILRRTEQLMKEENSTLGLSCKPIEKWDGKDLFSPPCIEIWRGIRPPCPTACSTPGDN